MSNFDNKLKKVGVTATDKHNKIPSSQLNLPMSLKAYVWYSAYVKEPIAWRTLLLLSDKTFQNSWKNKRKTIISGLTASLKQNAQQKKAQQQADDDFNSKIEYWYQYWFWLVSIREMTEKALTKISSDKKDPHEWRTILNNAKKGYVIENEYPDNFVELDHKNFEEITKIKKLKPSEIYNGLPVEIFTKMQGGNALPVEYFWTDTKKENEIVSSLIYLTVQKLITGTLGELSESVQLEFQKLIVNSNKTKEKAEEEAKKELKSKNIDIEFMDYHSFLKDLTPLWFKGTLGDVLATVTKNDSSDIEPKIVFEKLREGISFLNKEEVEKILNDNLKFVKFKKKANEFNKELFSKMKVFLDQYDKVKNALIQLLDSLIQNPNNIENTLKPYTYKGNPPNGYKFLERKREPEKDEKANKEYLSVPPWEGRWDTMKPPIASENGETEFLVEHRNN